MNGLNEIVEAVESGATRAQIAEMCGVSSVTLNAWMKRFPDLQRALTRMSDEERRQRLVESALLERALGGSVTAQTFWLKHRVPERWTERRDACDEDERGLAALRGIFGPEEGQGDDLSE